MTKKEIQTLHPSHEELLPRVSRATGQLEGVERMIRDRRYCPEIIQQLRAVQSAVKSIEIEILKTHMSSCLKNSVRSKNQRNLDNKINELLNLLKN